MKNLTVTTNENDTYTRQDLLDAMPAAQAGIIAEIGKILVEADERIEKLVKSHPLYQHMDTFYISGIMLEWEGEPSGIVQMVDDFPQYVSLVRRPSGGLSDVPMDRLQAELS